MREEEGGLLEVEMKVEEVKDMLDSCDYVPSTAEIGIVLELLDIILRILSAGYNA